MIPSDKKYRDDPQFRNLVDSLLSLISSQRTSFAEIREAVLFAQLRYEMANPQPITFSPDLLQELHRRMK